MGKDNNSSILIAEISTTKNLMMAMDIYLLWNFHWNSYLEIQLKETNQLGLIKGGWKSFPLIYLTWHHPNMKVDYVADRGLKDLLKLVSDGLKDSMGLVTGDRRKGGSSLVPLVIERVPNQLMNLGIEILFFFLF